MKAPGLPKPRWLVLGAAAVAAVAMPVFLLGGAEAGPPPPQPMRSPTIVSPRPSGGLAFALTAPPFDADRTPNAASVPGQATDAAASAAAAAPPPPPPPLPQLVGIASGRGRSVALLKKAGGETVMVGRGEAVDAWAVLSIGRDHAVLGKDGARHMLRFAFPNKAGGTPPPPPQVPPPPPLQPQPAGPGPASTARN